LALNEEFKIFVLVQLQGIGEFETKRMFGALKLYHQGSAFAKIKHDKVWLKVYDAIRFPVLYVLDGRYSFHSILGTKDELGLTKSLEEVIIGAIGSGLDEQSWLKNRLYDYTPTINTPRERALEKRWDFAAGELKSGGADKFILVLKPKLSNLLKNIIKRMLIEALQDTR
jgi:hypothetical protein